MTEPTPKDNFELAEFNSLKKEVSQQSSEQALLERQAILGMSVLYAVLATLSRYGVEPAILPFTKALWFAPTILILLGWLRWMCYYKAIAQIGNHIKDKYEHQTWEDSCQKEKIWQYDLLKYAWPAFALVSAGIAIWFLLAVSAPSEVNWRTKALQLQMLRIELGRSISARSRGLGFHGSPTAVHPAGARHMLPPSIGIGEPVD